MPRRCLIASASERVRAYAEPVTLVEQRRRLLHRAEGRVLDLSLRPEAHRSDLATRHGVVTELTLVSGRPAPARLWQNAPEPPGKAPVRAARLMTGPLHADAFPAGSFDTVVSVLTLCTIDVPVALLSAVARWLAPSGQLLVIEHIRATGFTALLQGALSPVERLVVGGCHLDQDVVGSCRQAGLDLTDGRRFSGRVAGSLPIPFFAGVARPRTRHHPPVADGGPNPEEPSSHV